MVKRLGRVCGKVPGPSPNGDKNLPIKKGEGIHFFFDRWVKVYIIALKTIISLTNKEAIEHLLVNNASFT